MILDAIISAFLACITSLVSLLPSFSIPAPDDNPSIVHYLAVWNGVVPIQFLSSCILASLAVALGFLVFDGSVWLYHQLHGSN